MDCKAGQGPPTCPVFSFPRCANIGGPMPKAIPAQESFLDVTFPVHGIDISTEFQLQRPQTTPVGVNVRAFEPSTNRGRGGSRPGLVQIIGDQLDGSPGFVQDLNTVVTSDSNNSLTVDEQAEWWPDPSQPPNGEIDPSTNYWYDFPGSPRFGDPRWFRNPGRAHRPDGSGIQPKRNYPHADPKANAVEPAHLLLYVPESKGFSVEYLFSGVLSFGELVSDYLGLVPAPVIVVRHGSTFNYMAEPESDMGYKF